MSKVEVNPKGRTEDTKKEEADASKGGSKQSVEVWTEGGIGVAYPPSSLYPLI